MRRPRLPLRRVAGLVVLALLGAAALTGCLPYTGPSGGPRLAQVGNSLTKLAGPEVTTQGNQQGWRVWWDGIVGQTVAQRRSMVDQAAADQPDVLVIELGTNDVAYPAAAAAGAERQRELDRIVADMRSAFRAATGSGTRCVVWVTPSSKATGLGYSWDPNVFNPLARAYAAEVVAEAARHPNAAVADWDRYLDGRSGWLQPDGIHTTQAGTRGLAQLILDTARDAPCSPIPKPPPPPAVDNWLIAPAAGRNADGRLEVVGLAADRTLQHASQTAPNATGWSTWAPFGGRAVGSPAMAANQDGRLEVFWVADDGRMYHAWQWGTGWSPAVSLGGSWGIYDGAAAATNADGRIEVFVIGADGRLYHNWQTAPDVGADGWYGWVAFEGQWRGSPAATRNADGRLEVFAIAGNGQLYNAWQTAPNSGWSGFISQGGNLRLDNAPAAARNVSGKLEVFAVGTDRRLYHKWQKVAGGAWEPGWAQLGTQTWRGSPAATENADGRLEVFVEGDDRQFWHDWQVAPDSPWNGWVALGGTSL